EAFRIAAQAGKDHIVLKAKRRSARLKRTPQFSVANNHKAYPLVWAAVRCKQLLIARGRVYEELVILNLRQASNDANGEIGFFQSECRTGRLSLLLPVSKDLCIQANRNDCELSFADHRKLSVAADAILFMDLAMLLRTDDDYAI